MTGPRQKPELRARTFLESAAGLIAAVVLAYFFVCLAWNGITLVRHSDACQAAGFDFAVPRTFVTPWRVECVATTTRRAPVAEATP